MAMVRTQIYLTKEINERLDVYRKKKGGIRKSEAIRRILEEYLGAECQCGKVKDLV